MKINIANPSCGTMKMLLIDDEKILREFYDKRMGQEIEGGVLGDDYKGYRFRISGGNDKDGFAMMQGVLLAHRVRLLLAKGAKLYRPRRKGERKRRSVRGCIVGPDLAVVNLVVTKKGEKDIPGLTGAGDRRPRRLGPKRASKIRKLFNLGPGDDVRKFVIERTFTNKKGKEVTKRPKIQRLVTPLTLQRKKRLASLKKARVDASRKARAEYQRLVAQRAKEQRVSKLASRRSSRKVSQKA